jgi:glyoxylase-like metal-dependent hydrolase (beta-lactamase superfamily II)
MRIDPNIQILKVGSYFLTMIWDDENLVLIDTGSPGQVELICEAIMDVGYFWGFSAANLTHIILTHQDMDHIGCVLDLLKIAPKAQVFAHEAEAPYMDGRKTPVKLEAALLRYDDADDEGKEQINEYKNKFNSLKFKVDKELKDGEILPIVGGIEVIHTPGHTPGHISLYLQKSRIMVLGDAAGVEDGQLIGFNPQYIQDMELSEKSIEKIKPYPVAGYIGHHSGFAAINNE